MIQNIADRIRGSQDRGRGGRRPGQALVEFALILPLLVVLIFAIIDWGYYLFASISVSHATRAAVRKAAMNNATRDQIKRVVVHNAVGVVVSENNITITTLANDPSLPGAPPSVSLTTQFDHKFFAPTLMGREKMPIRSTFKSIVTTYQGRTRVMF